MLPLGDTEPLGLTDIDSLPLGLIEPEGEFDREGLTEPDGDTLGEPNTPI